MSGKENVAISAAVVFTSDNNIKRAVSKFARLLLASALVLVIFICFTLIELTDEAPKTPPVFAFMVLSKLKRVEIEPRETSVARIKGIGGIVT